MNDSEKLAAISAIIFGNSDAAVPGHVMQDSGPENPTWDANDLCADDYWVRGRLGCMKGARHMDYSTSLTREAWSDSARLDRLVVITPALNPLGHGAGTVASVADASWMNGEAYVFNPALTPTATWLAWMAAGMPSRNAAGIVYDGRGFPIDPNGPHFSPT